ncbi:MAG: hypothetical protein JWQ96_1350 [Segetibacter sp.]|nr:hypothetical protein [Segetibacter sp.]
MFDQSKIPTGVLYDRVYPLAALQTFNVGSIDTSGYQHFLKAGGELKKASYHALNIITAEKLLYYNTKASLGENVELGVLNFSFNQIDPDADTNIVHYPQNYIVNGQYSFLLNKTVTIAAALADIAYTNNGSITFNWSNNNSFSNTNKTISYLSIDFGDGSGTHTLYNNNAVTISYQNKGTQFLTITTYYTDNTSSTNIAYLFVDGINFSGGNQRRIPDRLTDFPVERFESELQTAFQGYDETVATTGKGDKFIYLKSSNGGNPVLGAQLTKPIIILDGFDPGNQRQGRDIFNQTLEYNKENNSPKYLGDELTDAGNDLVILDFPVYQIGTSQSGIPIYRDGGSDYIERNAMVLVKLIKDINQTLINNSSQEQITIVGPSMGGLISRYALAYMEQNNIPHNCKLYVSFDAPHLGANIPIGDQLFLGFAAYTLDDDDAKEKFNGRLNNPAAKQMLIVHNQGFSGGNSNIEQQGAPGFRDRFKGVLNTIGFPQQIRKVAIANGSINGTLTGTPGMTVLDFQYTFDKNRFFLGRSGLISRISFTKSYGASSPIFNYWRRTGLFQSEEVIRGATFNDVCSIDAAPGGTYNTQQQIAEGLPPKDEQSGQHLTLKVNNLFPDHNFIPTISALAVITGSNDFCQPLYSRNLVCSNETPFATYYGPINKNMEHVTLDNDLVAWFKGELNGITQNPTTDFNSIYPIQLQSGTEPICNPATYTISNLPSGSSIVWSVNDLNIAGVDQSGTVSRVSNGQIVLTAAVTSTCGSFIASRNIIVGVPPQPGVISFPLIDYRKIQATIQDVPSAISYNWYKNNQLLTTHHGTFAQFPISRDCDIEYDISVEAVNGCGTSSRSHANAYVPCDNFRMSPNPATTSFTVEAVTTDEQTAGKTSRQNANTIHKILLTDKMGTVLKEYKYTASQKVTISISDLKADLYVVRIFNGKNWVSKQLSVVR